MSVTKHGSSRINKVSSTHKGRDTGTHEVRAGDCSRSSISQCKDILLLILIFWTILFVRNFMFSGHFFFQNSIYNLLISILEGEKKRKHNS